MNDYDNSGDDDCGNGAGDDDLIHSKQKIVVV